MNRYFGLSQELLLHSHSPGGFTSQKDIPTWPLEALAGHEGALIAEPSGNNVFARKMRELHNQAFCGFASLLNIDENDISALSYLRNCIDVEQYDVGELLMRPEVYTENSSTSNRKQYEPSLFYVLQGSLSVTLLQREFGSGEVEEPTEDQVIHFADRGTVVGAHVTTFPLDTYV